MLVTVGILAKAMTALEVTRRPLTASGFEVVAGARMLGLEMSSHLKANSGFQL